MDNLHSALAVALAGANPAGVTAQKLRARLDLYDESLVLTQYEQGLAVTCYEVAPQDVAAAFTNVPVSTGLLPEGCLWYRQSGGEQVGVYLPPQSWTLRAGDTVYHDVPLPGLVFCGSGVVYRVFAVKHRPVEGNEQLFHAPLPNVFNDGRICPGNVAFPVCTLRTIRAAIDLFFVVSDFNNHLAGKRCVSQPEDVRDLWRALSGAAAFPEDELLKTDLKLEDVWH